MPRRRLAVALLIPEPLATEIDGLRRALGAPLDHVAPHITLVPPVNVRIEAMPAALAVLRAGAASVAAPLALELGPVATFQPVNPVVYLAVGGPAAAVLPALRERVLQPPLERRIDLPFVPHVTLAEEYPVERTDGAMQALAAFRVTASISSVHLLDDDAPGPHRWNPIAEATLGPRVIAGRGGWELEVTVSSIPDPEVAGLIDGEPDVPDGARPVVAVARHAGAVVGAVAGWHRDEEAQVEQQYGDDDVVALLLSHFNQ